MSRRFIFCLAHTAPFLGAHPHSELEQQLLISYLPDDTCASPAIIARAARTGAPVYLHWLSRACATGVLISQESRAPAGGAYALLCVLFCAVIASAVRTRTPSVALVTQS